MDLIKELKAYGHKPLSIMGSAIPISAYTPLDLSVKNDALDTIDITDPLACQDYIQTVLSAKKAQIAYGGYLEKRYLYQKSNRFAEGGVRNIHLGLDFWCKAGSKIEAPIDGFVHSFGNNSDLGNYGPTLILSHTINEINFHTLYGHLSLDSLDGLYKNKRFSRGECLGTIGNTAINGGYAPHLHFQLIISMEGYEGDYPGVCSQTDEKFYRKNCPDPNLLLGFKI